MIHSEKWKTFPSTSSRYQIMSRPLLGQNLYSEDRVKPEPPFRPMDTEDKEISNIKKSIAKMNEDNAKESPQTEVESTSTEFNLLA